MALVEYDLFGEKRDKVKTAIDRLQAFEPQEGYYVADSGGGKKTLGCQPLAEGRGKR